MPLLSTNPSQNSKINGKKGLTQHDKYSLKGKSFNENTS